MTTHARLRQVADRALAAYSEFDFYLRLDEPVEEHGKKIVDAEREWLKAKAELLTVLS